MKSRLSLKFAPCFLDGMSGVLGVFFLATIVSDAADNFLRVVSAGKGAFGESPISFRLRYLTGRSGVLVFVRSRAVSPFILRVGPQPEVLRAIRACGFESRRHNVFLPILSVGEGWEAENAS